MSILYFIYDDDDIIIIISGIIIIIIKDSTDPFVGPWFFRSAS
jgi:hypothetical protein